MQDDFFTRPPKSDLKSWAICPRDKEHVLILRSHSDDVV